MAEKKKFIQHNKLHQNIFLQRVRQVMTHFSIFTSVYRIDSFYQATKQLSNETDVYSFLFSLIVLPIIAISENNKKFKL